MTGTNSSTRSVIVARLPRDGERLTLAWSEAERLALAERLGILAVSRLEADVTAAPWRAGGMSLRGRVRARAVQESAVTLEPLEQAIEEEVDLTFIPDTSELSKPQHFETGELELDPEGDDPPEPFTGGAVDLRAAIEEMFALALDPYPRSSSESFVSDDPAPALDEKPSPFAALKALKPGSTDG